MSQADIYETRVTLFLDILGFKNLIDKNNQELVLNCLSEANEAFRKFPFTPDASIKVSAFSDHILISDIPGESGRGYAGVISYASFLWWLFVNNGVLTRGAISVGNLHHKNGIVFGNALIDAFQMESSVAIYPRIIVSNAVYSGYIGYLSHLDKSTKNILSNILSQEFIRSDFDGMKHVNVFYPEGPFPFGQEPKEKMRERVSKCIGGYDDLSIQAKHIWLVNYMDSVMY